MNQIKKLSVFGFLGFSLTASSRTACRVAVRGWPGGEPKLSCLLLYYIYYILSHSKPLFLLTFLRFSIPFWNNSIQYWNRFIQYWNRFIQYWNIFKSYKPITRVKKIHFFHKIFLTLFFYSLYKRYKKIK